ncbi:serpentine type 7TM GPCR chemoreceptor srh domain-containing protein [Ditylenchus destructor]|nr:serpentine type 7TM GPCR chemoreceptor srh domain-containing protein [Ditylenchus destructor]
MSPLGYMAPVVAWITFTQLLSFTAIAVFLALLFRLAAVYGRSELFERKSVICACVILEFCYGVPVLISGLCNYPTEQQSLAYMETNNLELLPFYHSHACAVMIVATEVLIRYLSAVVPSVALIVGLIIGVLVLLIKRLSAWKHNISAKTYRMHKSLTISLCFQFALPMLMIAISESCFVLSAIFQFRSAKTIFYISFLFTTMHTSANGIIMITFVKPYRDAFLAMIPMLKAVQQRRRKGLAITQEFATRSTVILPEATRAQPKTITMLRSMSSAFIKRTKAMALIDVNRLPAFTFCVALSAFLSHQVLSAPAVPNAPAAAAPSNPSAANTEQQKRFDFNFDSKRFDFDSFYANAPMSKRFDFDGFYPPKPAKRFDGYYFAGGHPNSYGFL